MCGKESECDMAETVDNFKRPEREQWLRDNAIALESSNAYIEANGLPLARHRQF